MNTEFDHFINCILEAYDTDMERENERKAREYFSIGHHGGDDEDDDGTEDFCWIWVYDKLKVGQGHSHNITFGYHVVQDARFKGWYDVGKKILSFVDDKSEITTVDQIPQRLYSHLMRKFNPEKIKVF